MERLDRKIDVLDNRIQIFSINKEKYISLTDIARYKDKTRTDYIIQNWLRNRNTVEFLGIWEHLNTPDFKLVEFDQFRNEADYSHFFYLLKSGLNLSMLLACIQSQADTAERMLIAI